MCALLAIKLLNVPGEFRYSLSFSLCSAKRHLNFPFLLEIMVDITVPRDWHDRLPAIIDGAIAGLHGRPVPPSVLVSFLTSPMPCHNKGSCKRFYTGVVAYLDIYLGHASHICPQVCIILCWQVQRMVMFGAGLTATRGPCRPPKHIADTKCLSAAVWVL